MITIGEEHVCDGVEQEDNWRTWRAGRMKCELVGEI